MYTKTKGGINLWLDYYSFDAGNNNDKVAFKKDGTIKNLIFPAIGELSKSISPILF